MRNEFAEHVVVSCEGHQGALICWVCGLGDQESYESLVFNFLKIKIDKSSQFTDWSKRPLSKLQIDYASNDVNYLCDVYEHQKKLLDKINGNECIIEEKNKFTY